MDYYCSAKFTDLQVHVQSRLLYNCCMAYPERVDLDWLEANPGKLFHTRTMLEDRALMLDNKSCESCHFGCYKKEEQGLISERASYINQPKISDIHAPMRSLTLALSTDCNLACMYCSPEWSSSWHKDITKNGEYLLEGAPVHKTNNWHTLWSKMKQKSRGTESKFFSLLMREIKTAHGLENVRLIGGEPLLNNQLEQVMEHLQGKQISITTGLGVSHTRLQRILKTIEGTNTVFDISAESTGPLFELLRNGITWQDFQERVNMVEKSGHKIIFSSTISNLAVLGFNKFHDTYAGKHEIRIHPLHDRDWMNPFVLDKTSKEEFVENTKHKKDLPEYKTLLSMIDGTPNDQDRINTGDYLQQFSSRRSITLDFLPAHFLKWCGVKHN